MLSPIRSRRLPPVLAVLACVAGVAAVPATSLGDLSSRERALKRSIASDKGRIGAYQGRLRDLEARIEGIETSLGVQRALLVRIRGELATARAERTRLRRELAHDQTVLAAQLVAQYEAPTPDLVGVAIEAHGFLDLLERVDQMKLLAEHDANVTRRVARDKKLIERQAIQLAADETRQERVTASVLVERDEVVNLRLAVLAHERVAVRDQARKESELRRVRHQLAVLAARAAAAQRAAFAADTNGSTGGVPVDGGQYGFFPAPGTNYSAGVEPELARRLDRLGKALRLHLIGLSGYRSPQHSVEVGGFANDPHTRGEASDTPGVEGVSEQTLLQFGLTRPFPGPAEADHIQLS
jgi:peptidoglycan hydrolase CwlO-like protein